MMYIILPRQRCYFYTTVYFLNLLPTFFCYYLSLLYGNAIEVSNTNRSYFSIVPDCTRYIVGNDCTYLNLIRKKKANNIPSQQLSHCCIVTSLRCCISIYLFKVYYPIPDKVKLKQNYLTVLFLPTVAVRYLLLQYRSMWQLAAKQEQDLIPLTSEVIMIQQQCVCDIGIKMC